MLPATIVRKKLTRFASTGTLRVLDLFSGCGGMSLGFQRAGMKIVGAIEQDPTACRSHAENFFRGSSQSVIERHALPHDITTTDPSDYLIDVGVLDRPDFAVDVLIGGPPCQAFARIGRAKLREVTSNPNAHCEDARAELFLEFIRFAELLRPVAVLVENVPDMMNHGGVNVVARMCERLSRIGYECRYSLINAAHFGVPQFRERVFILGLHKSLRTTPDFPRPTHQFVVPTGYLGTRSVALKPIVQSGQPCVWWKPLRSPKLDSPQAVTCREALDDLPPLVDHLVNGRRHGIRKLSAFLPYPSRPNLSEYASIMRHWPDFESHDGIIDHVIRFLPRDYETFRRMKVNDQYPQAYAVANDRFQEAMEKLPRIPRIGTKTYSRLEKEFVPPYDPGKFPNKWWKLDPNKPSKTLTAHIGKDTYSHIHYDSRQARTISVREAARLQSFPDGFVFAGAMNAAFRQIGNAVPPLLAYALAKQLKRQMKSALPGKVTS